MPKKDNEPKKLRINPIGRASDNLTCETKDIIYLQKLFSFAE